MVGALFAVGMAAVVAACGGQQVAPPPSSSTTTVQVNTSSTTPVATAPQSAIALPAPPGAENSALCSAFTNQGLGALLFDEITGASPEALRARFTSALAILRELTPEAPIDQSGALIQATEYFSNLNTVIAPYNYDLGLAATDTQVVDKITPTSEQDSALAFLSNYETNVCATKTLPLITATP